MMGSRSPRESTDAPMAWTLILSLFLLLAPSSSFVPIRTEIAAERRVYLAIASVLVLLAVGAVWLRRRVADGWRQPWPAVATCAAVAVFYLAVSGWKANEISAALAAPGASAVALPWAIRLCVALGAAGLAWSIVGTTRPQWALAGVAALLAATTYERGRTYENPETLWRDVVTKMPENARGYDNLASAVQLAGPSRAREVSALLWRAIAVDSTYLNPYNRLASLAIDDGRPANARALLERAMAIDSNYVEGGVRLGDLLVASGEPARAVPLLERMTGRHPTDESFVSLGTAYLAAGRLDDAVTAFRRANALNPARSDILRYLGSTLLEQGKAAQAVPYLEDAARRTPGTGQSRGMLALAYAQAGQRDHAIAEAAEAAALAGGRAEIYGLAGRAMFIAGKSREADEYLTNAVRLSPANPTFITWLGMAKAARGDRADAGHLYRRALMLQPNFIAARQALNELERSGEKER